MLASKMDSILLMIPYMACKTLVAISVEDSSATNVKLKKELNVCSIVKGARENIALVAIQWNIVIYATMRNAASAMPLKLAKTVRNHFVITVPTNVTAGTNQGFANVNMMDARG